jgi:hypothetical protein
MISTSYGAYFRFARHLPTIGGKLQMELPTSQNGLLVRARTSSASSRNFVYPLINLLNLFIPGHRRLGARKCAEAKRLPRTPTPGLLELVCDGRHRDSHDLP